jgi:hypothetical protein
MIFYFFKGTLSDGERVTMKKKYNGYKINSPSQKN